MKRKIVLSLMAMLALSANLSAGILLIEPYRWEEIAENLSLDIDITTVEDDFQLEFTQAHDNLQIQITSADGTLYYMETVSVPAGTYVISVADLPAGEYCLQLVTEENEVRNLFFIKTVD